MKQYVKAAFIGSIVIASLLFVAVAIGSGVPLKTQLPNDSYKCVVSENGHCVTLASQIGFAASSVISEGHN